MTILGFFLRFLRVFVWVGLRLCLDLVWVRISWCFVVSVLSRLVVNA
jgi:hypothetical protein